MKIIIIKQHFELDSYITGNLTFRTNSAHKTLTGANGVSFSVLKSLLCFESLN